MRGHCHRGKDLLQLESCQEVRLAGILVAVLERSVARFRV